MLTAVPDFAAPTTWVQIFGRVAVHRDGESQRLTGSGQRLLAVLIAAGSDGATAERIAEEIWGDRQPNPWRPALRMAVARLRKRLPAEWDVVADGGFYRITTSDGWVDAWRLEEIASAGSVILEDDLAWMLAGRPFGDVDLLEMVGASTQNLQMLQITIAERFCFQAPELVSTTTCSVLTALVRDHPYNDRLAVVVAQTLAAAARRTEALLALSAFAEAYASEFGAVPADVAAFLTSGGQRDEPKIVPVELAHVSSPPDLIAKELRHLAESPLFGRTEELRALRKSRGALVTGVTGAGKSRLLAGLITEDPATETTYVVGDDRLDLRLGPFAVAMPTLRDELLASADQEAMVALDEGSAERAASTRAWRIVLANLEARSASRPQRLVVDDAHLLDPSSLGLLRLLIRSNTTADLTFVVCGRSDFDDAEWVELVRDAERAGLDPIALAGLDVSEIELMVLQQFPDASYRARRGLAVDVHEASGGLPAVAVPLIESADPETMALPEQLSGASALARVTASFSEQAPEVVAAAVLGRQFSIGELIALTEVDESSIFRTLDELWSMGLILETDDPDQLRFSNVLIQRAFLEGVPLFRRGELHRRAAELTDDPHQKADHQFSAGVLVPGEITATSLRESARLHADRRSWRKVARELRRIDELPGEHLDAASLTLWASALDQSGSDGAPHRRVAYSLAIESADWNTALDAALSGLPQAELPDGDTERVEMLEGIPDEGLAHSRRFDRVYNLGRQFSLLGNKNDQVLRYAEEALSIAADADEIGLSHVLRWMATRHVEPQAHMIPADVVHRGSPRILMRIAQINALNLAEQGDFSGARAESERFSELAGAMGDTLRIWHAQGLRGMFLLNDGDFEAAEELALENMKFADLHDMQQGTSTYIGHRVYSFDCQDRLIELDSQLAPFRSNLSRLVLGRAALVLTGHAAGRTDIADELRAVVSEAQTRSGSTFSLLATIFLSRHLPEYAPELVPPTRVLLEKFGDAPIMAGFGAGTFGPTTRYVAQLSSDLDEKSSLIDVSITAADRHGPLLWRVHTRLDKAELGSGDALEESIELAAGTGLAPVVARRAERLRD